MQATMQHDSRSPFSTIKIWTNLYSHTYPHDGQEESVREGFDPTNPEPHNPEQAHNLSYPFTVEEGEEDEDSAPPVNKDAEQWDERDYGNEDEQKRDKSPQYGSFRDEHNAWNDE
jgi:hypothetical protein